MFERHQFVPHPPHAETVESVLPAMIKPLEMMSDTLGHIPEFTEARHTLQQFAALNDSSYLPAYLADAWIKPDDIPTAIIEAAYEQRHEALTAFIRALDAIYDVRHETITEGELQRLAYQLRTTFAGLQRPSAEQAPSRLAA